ncbi:hypothetical protein HDK64DRAFT_281909 [Phyllosticta capitalensis]
MYFSFVCFLLSAPARRVCTSFCMWRLYLLLLPFEAMYRLADRNFRLALLRVHRKLGITTCAAQFAGQSQMIDNSRRLRVWEKFLEPQHTTTCTSRLPPAGLPQDSLLQNNMLKIAPHGISTRMLLVCLLGATATVATAVMRC